MIVLKINGVDHEVGPGLGVSYTTIYPELLSSVSFSSDPGGEKAYDEIRVVEEKIKDDSPWVVDVVQRESGSDDVILGSIMSHSMRSTIVHSDGSLYRSLNWK